MLKKQSLLDGALSSYPICIAFSLMFFSLGTLANFQGFSLGETALMSATIFAVPAQLLIINGQDLPMWSIAINAFILNFKFLLMSAVLIPLWSDKKKRMTVPALHFICSSTYMVCSSYKTEDPWSFYLGVSIPSYLTAVLATILGYLTWSVASAHQEFLSALAHIVLPTHFMCLTMKRKNDKGVVIATLLGLAATPLLIKWLDKQALILIWFVMAFILLKMEKKPCGK